MLILPNTNSVPNRRRKMRDAGYMLLAILLMVAFLAIALTYEAPRMVQQLKRDREEEMIHRGTEYERAIKKYYKKFGSYPATIEQLENTNNIRFLRKRYKDPLTKDGKWTLLHYTDVAALLVGAGGPGVPAAALGSQGLQSPGTPPSSPFGSAGAATPGGLGASTFGGGNPQSSTGGQGGTFSLSSPQNQSGLGQQGTSGSSLGSPLGSTSGQGATTGSSSSGAAGSTSGSSSDTGSSSASSPGDTSTSSSTALGAQNSTNQTFGGGAIVGVASKSKDPTIRIYNKKKTYDEWVFIYNPMMDQSNVLLTGPYNPSAFTSSNIGTPAGQLNQQNQQQSPFGQPSGGAGAQQPSGFGNQTLTPGGQQFPPDQSH